VIERAKGLLMKHRGLSEADAHAAMRKMAMSRNKKLVEIAEGIIAAFDLLG
jgi:response regulator NasT